jgi:hypothetical protein
VPTDGVDIGRITPDAEGKQARYGKARLLMRFSGGA